MPISDLTGTTWVIEAQPYEFSYTESFDINITSNNSTYTGLGIFFDIDDDEGEILYGVTLVYDYFDSYWVNEAYSTITITGGTDVTNANLIAWLEQHATRQGGSQLSVDLSTLSGWSNVSSGSHTLKVKAKATGYQDSALSAGASFVKAGSGYTGTVLTTDGYMPADIYIDRIPTGESDTADYTIFGNDSHSFSCSEYFYMLDWTFDVQNINSYSGCTYERVNGQTFGASNAYGYKVFPTENGWTFNVRFED